MIRRNASATNMVETQWERGARTFEKLSHFVEVGGVMVATF